MTKEYINNKCYGLIDLKGLENSFYYGFDAYDNLDDFFICGKHTYKDFLKYCEGKFENSSRYFLADYIDDAISHFRNSINIDDSDIDYCEIFEELYDDIKHTLHEHLDDHIMSEDMFKEIAKDYNAY